MAIKFNLPKKDIKTGNSSIASTGGYNKSASSNKNSAYVGSSTANMPITKNAQMAGSGASVIWTQPMFFSPLHTPQNWQIASKRREVYQWSFISPCNIASYDGSLRDISEIFEEMAIPTSSYISSRDEVQDGYGNMVCPDKSSKRWINKKANKITVTGLPESLTVTYDHKCMIIRRDNVICKYHNKKFCVSEATRSCTCERSKCYKSDNKSYDITTVDAQDVLVGDFALIPFNTEIKESIIKTIEEARYAGHLASDGWVCNGSTKSGYKVAGICMNTEEKEYVMPAIASVYKDRDSSLEYMEQNSAGTLLMTRNSSSKVYDFALQLICGKSSTKKFTDQVLYLHPDLQRHVLGAYIQSDGTYNKANDVYEITTYSKHLANQLLSMSFRCGILARLNKQPLSSSKSTFDSKNEFRYILNIPSSECSKISEYVPGKSKNINTRKKGCSWRFFWKNFVVSRVRSNESFDYEGYVYDIRVPGTFTVTANNIAAHQCRFYYDNEPKVAAGVDFYSIFPMNGFTLECKNKRVLKYFEKISKRLRINYWLKLISHEYFLLGDVFPFLEISCPNCGGSGTLKTGEMCNHSGGTVKRIVVLNPDWIEVQTNVLANEPVVALVPDDELRMIVQRKQPKQIYDKLPKKLIELIASGMPISLSNRCVSHIKHNASPYGIYGTAMLRRLFTVLAYKTKLMTANWIVAERLILPIRVVKIGDKDRPASPEDISDVSSQLAAVANDPNLTLVTHHAFDYQWYGASGKIQSINTELEYVGKEILDGLMLNQALLNGEMSGYSSAQVGVEVMIRRLDSWRNELAEWVENHIFLPIAMMQGFIDEEETEEMGETAYLTPTVKWNDLQLRDTSNIKQMFIALHDKKLVSSQTLLDQFDVDYDQEIEKIREETIAVGAQGQMGAPGGGSPMGGMPPGGGGGGAPGGPPPGAPPGGDMAGGAPMGGDMAGGAAGGGAPPGGAPMGATAGSTAMSPGFKISKRGKGKNPAEAAQEQQPQSIRISLTKLEQKMYKVLIGMGLPYKTYAQYKVAVAGQQQPFVIDFAMPEIGIGIETDGAQWHEQAEAKAKDQQRDQKLAGLGWRILRFREKAIEDRMNEVQNIISQNIETASKYRKKAAADGTMIKEASINFDNIDLNDIVITKESMGDDLGDIFIIGVADNG